MSTGVQSTTPLFVTLTELDHQRMTLRDWLTLLPAVVLSFLLNGILMTLLVFTTGSGPASAANRLRDAAQEDETTQLQDQKKAEDEEPTIDINTPEFDAPKDIIQSEKLAMPALDLPPEEKPTSLTTPPPEKEPIGGAGRTEDGKLRGADALGEAGLKGDPIFGDLGAIGSSGSLPMGGGAGILTGQGGGSSKSGGFGYRSGDLSGLAKVMGGSDESERAVARALLWLRNHQSPDGRWSLDKYHTYDNRCNCQVPIERVVENERRVIRSDDVSGTALGVLPFLAAGHHHNSQKEEGKTVAQAIRFLLSRQQAEGGFLDGPADMYTHGLASIALCEAYGMTGDPKLREAAQKAINFIVKAQDTQRGGWRYQPKTTSDTSIVGWQVMALKSAQMAGLQVPASTLENATRWLDLAQYKKKQPDGRTFVMYAYSYDQNEPNAPGGPATTAAGLLNRLYLGWGPRHADMIAGCDYLMASAMPPAEHKPGQFKNVYTYYYAAQVMHHMGGEYWQQWNPKMRDYLIKSQEREGHKAGSWDPTGDAWGRNGGRLYTTSLSVLTLEVYYRHLPLYRREKIDEELAKKAPAEKNAMEPKK
jgi:hypothetical protein